MESKVASLDATDTKALQVLQTHGRMSWAELGQHIELSPPAAAERVRRLEENGTIRRFAAELDPDAAGFPLLAFVFVTLINPSARKKFLDEVKRNQRILECHHVAGDDDYLLKVRCATMQELDAILTTSLKSKAGVARTRTTIALGTAKETLELPVVE